ncbi:FecR family protein [Lysobacter enzymogenes]|uniref:DUF4880 domain-containing protein n=1 Tax=Lysobacter enzymogenes TaxID=69 RepID=A0A3N2RFQ0_LYSEN|nr:FecR domain-containing protein [Lysobacter enzymogenes]ROU06271.1 DUF4880 domain-containing protein [Lysobacter enzymogenes]
MNITTLPPSRDYPDSAEGWLARLLSPDCDSGDFAAFEDWVALSPAHAVAYAEAERLHAMAREARAERAPAALPAAPSARIGAASMRPRRRAAPALAWAAAVVVALASALGGWMALRPAPPLRYATAVGERLTLDLADGSTLTLDTGTALEVALQRSQRQIRLLHGRMQANVAHDRDRPFIVASGDGSVRAVGTVFQVENRDGRTEVRLLEGRVVVATRQAPRALELAPLQRIGYGADGRLGAAETIDRAEAEGWTRGRLVFKERRLGDLLAEVNRYSRDRLILAEPELGEVRISGAFAADDRPALIAALQRGWGLRAKRTGADETTLYRQQD